MSARKVARGTRTASANVPDDGFDVRMEERLAPAQGDDAGAELGQPVDTTLKVGVRHRT